MKRLMKYLKEYKVEAVLAPLFKMLEASFELFVPLVVAAIVDTGIGQGRKSYITQMVILMIVLGIIGLTCSLIAQYFSAKAAVGVSSKIRHVMFKHIQSLSFDEIDRLGNATLITRMTSDVNQVQTGINLVLRLLLRSPFVVFGAMIMAFTVDVKAALVFVVIIPILFAVVFLIMYITIPLYKKVQQKLDRVLGKTRENLSGTRVIRAFNKEKTEIEQYDEENEGLNSFQIKVGKISALMNPITFILINGATIVLIYTGAIRVDNGSLTQGQVIALVNYMSQILVELIKFANLIITVNKAIASGNRIADMLEIPTELSPARTESKIKENEAYIQFHNVSLTYNNAGEPALSNIDFKVKEGDIVGVIGGTGSGKSSLVNLIPGFYKATEGQVMVAGKNVNEYNREELLEKIGIVLQKAVLFKGSIRDNIKWGKKDATDEEINEALTKAMAKEIVDGKPNGLDEIIEQGGKNLSGGQKQRLTIARALVKKPEILILDDSSSALDYATDARLRQTLRELDYCKAVFIVSQRTSSIQHADKIIVLDDGQMVGVGTHEELLENCQVYREIHEVALG